MRARRFSRRKSRCGQDLLQQSRPYNDGGTARRDNCGVGGRRDRLSNLLQPFGDAFRITAVVVDEKLRDGGRPSPLEFFETGPSLQELGRNIGTDFIEPGEHLREVHLQMLGKPI